MSAVTSLMSMLPSPVAVLQSASSVQAAMRKLLEYGLVTTESGSYHIEDQLFYHWLLNN